MCNIHIKQSGFCLWTLNCPVNYNNLAQHKSQKVCISLTNSVHSQYGEWLLLLFSQWLFKACENFLEDNSPQFLKYHSTFSLKTFNIWSWVNSSDWHEIMCDNLASLPWIVSRWFLCRDSCTGAFWYCKHVCISVPILLHGNILKELYICFKTNDIIYFIVLDTNATDIMKE
jgi:hypothetical protein